MRTKTQLLALNGIIGGTYAALTLVASALKGVFSQRLVRRICPHCHNNLPDVIGRFTYHVAYDETNPHLSFKQGGGHGGSHPHLVHEFVMSIIEDRKPWIDEVLGANITAAGICAHLSAMQNGKEVIVPEF